MCPQWYSCSGIGERVRCPFNLRLTRFSSELRVRGLYHFFFVQHFPLSNVQQVHSTFCTLANEEEEEFHIFACFGDLCMRHVVYFVYLLFMVMYLHVRCVWFPSFTKPVSQYTYKLSFCVAVGGLVFRRFINFCF